MVHIVSRDRCLLCRINRQERFYWTAATQVLPFWELFFSNKKNFKVTSYTFLWLVQSTWLNPTVEIDLSALFESPIKTFKDVAKHEIGLISPTTPISSGKCQEQGWPFKSNYSWTFDYMDTSKAQGSNFKCTYFWYPADNFQIVSSRRWKFWQLSLLVSPCHLPPTAQPPPTSPITLLASKNHQWLRILSGGKSYKLEF